jgi:hypothetical protein
MATDNHVAHVQQLTAKLAGGPGFNIAEVQGASTPREPAGPVATPEVVDEATPPPVDETVETPEEPEAVAAPAPRTERNADRLRRSVEIEKRAQAVKAKAAADARASREQVDRADRLRREADARARHARELEKNVRTTQSQVQGEIDLLKTNPLAFAAKYGVTGKEIADYIKSGADPHSRRMDLESSRVAQALERIEQNANKRIDALEQRLVGDRVAAAEETLLAQVTADQDRFEALNTIYSPSEVIDRANTLAERNEKLSLGWDGDRLIEELEKQARKDPRWSRIQTRFARKAAPPTSRTARETPSQAAPSPATDEQRRTDATRQGSPPTERKPREQLSARDRHRLHVQRLMRTTRFR